MMIFDSTHASCGEPQVAGRLLAFICSLKTAALKGTHDGAHCHATGSTWKNLLSVCSEPIHMKRQFNLLSIQLSHAYLLSWLMLLLCHCTAVFKSAEPAVNSRFLKSCTSPTPGSFNHLNAELNPICKFLMLTSLVCKRILRSHTVPTETLHWVLAVHVCNTSSAYSMPAKSKPSFQQEACFCQCDWIP